MTSDKPHRHHRPSLPGAGAFEALPGGADPAMLRDAADQAATALVRRTSATDTHLVDRVVHLIETEGIDAVAQLWSTAPADTLAGALWRLYLLRSWVHTNPELAAHEFEAGRHYAPVAEVVSGVEDPPGPKEVRALVDQVLGGVVTGDFADALFRAAAFARVAAVGRATDAEHDADNGLSAARLLTMSDQLQAAGRLELQGRLG